MTFVAEIEKPQIKRKRFTTLEFQEMVKVGILPEEHGWEVIDGYLTDKMTIGTKHAKYVRRLTRILERKIGNEILVSSQNPIYLDEFNEPEPDIALLVWKDDEYESQHPTPKDVLIAMEVSDSTIKYDREVKKVLYAEAEIKEFWLINLSENTIEIHTQPKKGSYRNVQIFGADDELKSVTIENLVLNVNEILDI
jgi:Uma2 family endonuclease